MTRIVAGDLGGRRIEVPQRGTRPTRERVRESLFGALESMLDLTDLRVLDLYGGSGALGLEALSRGASHATFVESDRSAARLLRRNAESLGVARDVRIEQLPVGTALAACPREPYELVLIDPPYAVESATLDREYGQLVTNSWVAPDGLVIVERPVQSAEPRWPAPLTALRSKNYGDTVVYWAEYPSDECGSP